MALTLKKTLLLYSRNVISTAWRHLDTTQKSYWSRIGRDGRTADVSRSGRSYYGRDMLGMVGTGSERDRDGRIGVVIWSGLGLSQVPMVGARSCVVGVGSLLGRIVVGMVVLQS